MSKSPYRHPLHDTMAEMIRAGKSNKELVRTLGVSPRAAARVRSIIGAGDYVHDYGVASPEEKLATFSAPVDEHGHTGWTGRRAGTGQPTIRAIGGTVMASHVAFQARAGRPPVGVVKAHCGVKDCLTGDHLSDERERLGLRMLQRAFYGLDPQPWDVCPAGLHAWDTDGRLNPDLTPYCLRCNSNRIMAKRKAGKILSQ